MKRSKSECSSRSLEFKQGSTAFQNLMPNRYPVTVGLTYILSMDMPLVLIIDDFKKSSSLEFSPARMKINILTEQKKIYMQ